MTTELEALESSNVESSDDISSQYAAEQFDGLFKTSETLVDGF
jgi:hypothetical protein